MQYIATWIALAVLLSGSVMLLVLSWNGLFPGPPAAALMILTWLLVAASGIFLFMLAVKKAQRLYIDEARRLEQERSETEKRLQAKKRRSGDQQQMDFTAMARKLVRRIPDEASLEEAGKMLIQYLARDLEIMSGIFYLKKKQQFEAISTYAVVNPEEPYSFREGEGLSGQAAKNGQVMMLTRLPEAHLEVCSGLGKAKPAYLALVPFVRKNRTVALLEFSGFRYAPHDIETLCRILARDLMQKLSPEKS